MRPESNDRAMMGICVGQSCIGVASAGFKWSGNWRHARTQHEEAFPPDAPHVQRIDGGVRAASVIAQWALDRGVKRVWLHESANNDDAQSELSALVVAELTKAGIDVSAAGVESAHVGTSPRSVRAGLLEQGAPQGLCTVQYLALAMLGVARLQREQAAEQLPGASR